MNLGHWLAIFGVTFLICDAKILNRPREWLISKSTFISELLECYFCSGFWVSLLIHAVELRQTYQDPIAYVWQVVLGGFAGASFAFFFNSLCLALEHHARNHQ